MNNLKRSILTLVLLVCTINLFAQNNPEEVQKKIVIVKKMIDENGNETVEEVTLEGDEADAYMEELDIDIEIEEGNTENRKVRIMKFDSEEEMPEGIRKELDDMNIDINTTYGDKKIKIKTDGADVKEYNSTEELPDDVKETLKKHGINFKKSDKNKKVKMMQMKSPSSKAFLGVKMKKEVENINGVETITGESEEGVLIDEVIEESAAAEAGIQAGDIITALDAAPTQSIEAVTSVLMTKNPGDQVSISYLRNGQALQTTATLKEGTGSTSSQTIEINKWINEDGEEINIDGDAQIYFIDENDNEEEVSEKRKTAESNQTLDLSEISIFPNPTDGKITLEFTAPAQPIQIKIIDVNGKEVYNKNLKRFDGRFKKVINLKNASKGTLLLSILQGNEVYSEKFILK